MKIHAWEKMGPSCMAVKEFSDKYPPFSSLCPLQLMDKQQFIVLNLHSPLTSLNVFLNMYVTN